MFLSVSFLPPVAFRLDVVLVLVVLVCVLVIIVLFVPTHRRKAERVGESCSFAIVSKLSEH